MGLLDGRVAVVTGASAGIGAATAADLARAGALVVAGARRFDRLCAVTDSINTAGGRALAVRFDVTSEADRHRLIEAALDAGGRLDILVNNAGSGQPGPVEAIPIERIRQTFETNFFGLVALTQLAIPILREGGGGRIINVSSIAGRIARPFSVVYDATKHALEALSDGLRHELAPFMIQVVTIEPGFIVTEFTTVARQVALTSPAYAARAAAQATREGRRRSLAGTPEDVARVIRIAATVPSPRSRYIVPRFAQVAILLKRVLPERLFERISGIE